MVITTLVMLAAVVIQLGTVKLAKMWVHTNQNTVGNSPKIDSMTHPVILYTGAATVTQLIMQGLVVINESKKTLSELL